MKKHLLKFKSWLLLLCMIVVGNYAAWAQSDKSTDYTGNITLSTAGGTSASTCKVVINQTEYDGIKAGTAKAAGAVKVTVPSGAKYLHIHVAGWNGESVTLSVSPSSNVSSSSIGLTADSGVSNNTPFTLAGTLSNYYKVITFTNALTANTDFTFTATGGKRFVIWGVTSEETVVVKDDPTITFNNGSVRVGQNLDLSTLFESNSTGAVTYSITAGDSYASLDGSILTGGAVGSVTVKAEQAAAGNYNAGEATATISIEAAKTLSSIAVTTAPTKTKYTEGETFDPTGMVVTATYSDSSKEDVTASCTFSPSTALTTSNAEITVSYTENEVEKTTTQAITVNALPKYTVTFADDSSTETQASYGASVTLPSRSEIAGYAFAGWSATNVPTKTTTAPTIIPAGSYTPTEDITLYPVYSKTESGVAPSAFSVGDTGNFAIVAELSAENYYALPTSPTVSSGKITAQKITVNEIDDVKFVTPANASGFTWTIAAATNGYTLSDGSHYIYHSNGGSSGTNLTYGDATTYTWAFTADGDYIKMAGMSGSTTNNRGLLFSDTTIGGYSLSNWESYDKTMILPIANAGTTYYWSAPVAAAVEKPTITVTSPFTFSTEVTMSCETEGATIYYTLDESDPTAESTEYTAPFNINATTTIKAIAIKDANASSIATVTATKNLATPIVTVSGDLTVDLNGETYVEAGTLTAAVTYNEAPVDGAAVTWSSSNADVATIGESTGVVTIKTRGTVTFTATYAGNGDYAEATDTKQITVTDSKAPGSAGKPYTVVQAKAAIDASEGTTGVYVAGIVSQVDSYNSKYSSITYWISDDGTTTNQFEVYSGKGIGGADFESIDDIQVGDRVVVKGDIKLYNTTYEFDKNNQLVSRVEKPASDLAKTSDIALDVKNNALTANIADHISSSSAGAYTYESADETVATVSAEGVVTGLKVGSTTITVNQAATLSYKAGTVEIPVTVADTRVAATTIPAINISSLPNDDEGGTIVVVDPVKADEGVTFSFESSDENVLYIEGTDYIVTGIGTATVTVTATASNSALYKNVTETFEVTVNAAKKSENVIELAFDSYSTVWGTNLEGIVGGSQGFDGTITATSSNPKVLTVAVDAEGNVTVTPVAVGSATVTFSAAETASFLAAENVQQVFTITAPAGITTAPANGFVKVTDTENITDGEYLIVYEGGSVAFDGSLETLDATENTIDVEITDGVIAATNATKAATFTIDVTAGTLQSKSGFYIGKEATANGMDSDTETQYTNTFAIENNVAVITSSGNCVLKYNSASNQKRFRYYKSGQQDIQLYKLNDPSETVTINKYGYATYCSVNPMDFSETEGYTAWYVSHITSDGVITFNKITGTIKGGQGVLLYNIDADEVNTSNVNVKFASSENELVGNLLVGTTAPTYVEEAGSVYGLSGKSFKKNSAAGTIGANKAYLDANDIPNEVQAFTFVFEDDETGITETRTVTREEVESIFNLAGQRLNRTQKGINIVNGKKVFIKK